jgi:hypothetical protein
MAEDERELTRISERKKREEEENEWERCLYPNKLCWKLEMEGTVPLACPFQQEWTEGSAQLMLDELCLMTQIEAHPSIIDFQHHNWDINLECFFFWKIHGCRESRYTRYIS